MKNNDTYQKLFNTINLPNSDVGDMVAIANDKASFFAVKKLEKQGYVQYCGREHDGEGNNVIIFMILKKNKINIRKGEEKDESGK